MKFFIEIADEIITSSFERLDNDKASLLKHKDSKEAVNLITSWIEKEQKYLDTIIIGKE